MAKPIDWMYDRKSCTTCKRSRAFLGEAGCAIAETVDATKTRYDHAAALALLADARTLIAMKGTKVLTFDLAAARPADEVLTGVLIGPTGNLRAPTLRVGDTMLVGFSEAAYREHLGVDGGRGGAA